ncbi:MAG: FeoC-like transcriptional regulator [Magnetococcales bacterium]|nr:FeoC-like transcriptional regulator [Magnetococcales bacterium]MBF0114215.1 FeoC-like transcriptional regulator [Magnetococcales bacterium]
MATLSALRDYLSEKKEVPLMDLAHQFHKDPEVLRDMLAHWVRKGKVQLYTGKSACQSQCGGCGQQSIEICRWIEPLPDTVQPTL